MSAVEIVQNSTAGIAMIDAKRLDHWPSARRYASQNAPMDRAFGHWDLASAYQFASGAQDGCANELAGDFLIAGTVVWRTVPAAEQLLFENAEAGERAALSPLLALAAAKDAPRLKVDIARLRLPDDLPMSWKLDVLRAELSLDKFVPSISSDPIAELILRCTEAEIPELRARLEKDLGRHTPAFHRGMAAFLERVGQFKAAAAHLEALSAGDAAHSNAPADAIRLQVHIARLNGAANDRPHAAKALWRALRLADTVEHPEAQALWLEQIAYTGLVIGQARAGIVAYMRAADIHGRLRGARDVRCAVALVRAGDLLLRQGKLHWGVRLLERACVGLGLDYLYQSTGAEALSYWVQGQFRLAEFDRALSALGIFLEEKRIRKGPIWPSYYVHLLNVVAASAPDLQIARLISTLSNFIGGEDADGGEDRSDLRTALLARGAQLISSAPAEAALLAARSSADLAGARWDATERTEFIQQCLVRASEAIKGEGPNFPDAGAWLRVGCAAADGQPVPAARISTAHPAEVPLPTVEAPIPIAPNIGGALMERPGSRATGIKLRLMPLWTRLPAPLRVRAKPVVIQLATVVLRRRH